MKTFHYVDGEYESKSEIKRSLFIATVRGEVDAAGAEEFVRAIRRKYSDATHNCYAYISDELGNVTRFSDDGEPGGTAGQPILDVLRKQKLRKTAIVVTRYFGGVKLGAGGLVGAYSGAAADAVATAKIAEKCECRLIKVKAGYTDCSALETFLRKKDCSIADIRYSDSVDIDVFVPLDAEAAFLENVFELTAGRAEVLTTNRIEYVKLISER